MRSSKALLLFHVLFLTSFWWSSRLASANELTKFTGAVYYYQKSGNSSKLVGLPENTNNFFGKAICERGQNNCLYGMNGFRLGRKSVLALTKRDPYGSERTKILSLIDISGKPILPWCDLNDKGDDEIVAVLTPAEYLRWRDVSEDKILIRSPKNVYRFSRSKSSIIKLSSQQVLCGGQIENIKYFQP
jgi:hypothetical protein